MWDFKGSPMIEVVETFHVPDSSVKVGGQTGEAGAESRRSCVKVDEDLKQIVHFGSKELRFSIQGPSISTTALVRDDRLSFAFY